MGCPIRKSPDQSLFAAPRRLSQRITSFIASCYQGIHQMPLRRLITLIIDVHSMFDHQKAEAIQCKQVIDFKTSFSRPFQRSARSSAEPSLSQHLRNNPRAERTFSSTMSRTGQIHKDPANLIFFRMITGTARLTQPLD